MEQAAIKAKALKKRGAGALGGGIPTTQDAYAAQQAYLNQAYGQAMTQMWPLQGMGQQQSGIVNGMVPTVPTVSNGTNGSVPSYLLPNGGGPYAGYAPSAPSLASLLGIEIATPSTVGLHDALTEMARRAGLVQ